MIPLPVGDDGHTMPEGDTVWLAGRRLHDALAGRPLTRSDFRVPQLATVDLSGRTVTEVVSRGKHLLTRVDDDLTLHTHFRMDGSWHLYRPGDRWRGGPEWQVRVLLENAGWQAVGYRLPVVELLPRDREADGGRAPRAGRPRPGLGPRRGGAPAGRRPGPARSARRCSTSATWPGSATSTRPSRSSCTASPRGPRWATCRTCPGWSTGRPGCSRRTRDRSAQVTTGDPRRGRGHWVFERAGRPCLRCGTPVASAEQGRAPYQRISYWCPTCQRGPAPEPAGPVRRGDRPAGRTRYRP